MQVSPKKEKNREKKEDSSPTSPSSAKKDKKAASSSSPKSNKKGSQQEPPTPSVTDDEQQLLRTGFYLRNADKKTQVYYEDDLPALFRRSPKIRLELVVCNADGYVSECVHIKEGRRLNVFAPARKHFEIIRGMELMQQGKLFRNYDKNCSCGRVVVLWLCEE